jgi:hypothetical protein
MFVKIKCCNFVNFTVSTCDIHTSKTTVYKTYMNVYKSLKRRVYLENLTVDQSNTKLDFTETGRGYEMNIWATISF